MTVFARLLDGLVLAVWGVVAVGFVLSGRVGSYLHPAFHGWVFGSGCVLLLIAAATVALPPSECGCCGGHGGGALRKVLQSAVLVVPLLVAVAVSPSQFGAVAVRNRGLADSLALLPGYKPFREPGLPRAEGGFEDEGAEVPLSAMLDFDEEGRIAATVVDLLYAANIPELRPDFEGLEVAVVGQFLPARRNNPSGDRFSLVRMFIMCCAADARPLAIPVSMPEPVSFPEMSWVRVAGVVRFPVEGGQVVPLIEARRVESCEAPPETFLY